VTDLPRTDRTDRIVGSGHGGHAERNDRLVEAAAAAAGAAILGGLIGRPFGVGRLLGAIAAVNGAISGWRRIYDWRNTPGRVAFVLDSTWALATTTGSLVSHVIAVVRGRPGYDSSLSVRQNRHVYQRGFQPRRQFVVTVGNVISGAGDTTDQRRRHLVQRHEDSHVWQSRFIGPGFPVLYGTWMGVGAVVGALMWALRLRQRRFASVVETYAYYLNPFEWWAYSREGNWPPAPCEVDLAWKRPLVSARP
jgi:hypothetical protein